MDLVALAPVGVAVGVLGSLIGVGGGFFVVPFLMLVLRFGKEPATAASLGIVFLSAASATLANGRRGRVDWATGGLIAAGTLPGAWLGRELIGRLEDRVFSLAFAGLLLAVALYLVLVRLKPGQGLLRGKPRERVDSEGQAHRYEVNGPAGLAVSLGVGLISSLFGIGGGLVLVPFLVLVYGMPMVVATATAQFAFVWAAALGAGEAWRRGQLSGPGLAVVGAMGLGVVIGAQVGVALGKRVPERVVKGLLAAVMVAVAVLMAARS